MFSSLTSNQKEHKMKKPYQSAINLNYIACFPNSRRLMMNLHYMENKEKKELAPVATYEEL